MASIALSVVGCIDYLAYGTIFTRVMFLSKKKGDVFFLPEKPQMSAGGWWGVLKFVCLSVCNAPKGKKLGVRK
jgi:hypothetical protein